MRTVDGDGDDDINPTTAEFRESNVSNVVKLDDVRGAK
jgi:hypothetical protein